MNDNTIAKAPPAGGTPDGGVNTKDVEAKSQQNQKDAMEMQRINLESQAFYANLQAAKGITDRADQFFKSVSDTIGRA